jgi:23S rRNA pseudouridine1911/1915/1917 synthase
VTVRTEAPTAVELVPQAIDVPVVYEDDDVIVVYKPAGLVVHPAPGHPDGTLVNALLHLCGDRLAGVGGELRPGIVHRIDRDTSGLLVATRNDRAHRHLQAQFAAHTVQREYRAIVARTSGPLLPSEGTFDTAHGRHPTDRKRFTGKRGRRRAVTHFRVLERFASGAALVACTLETGRTHQIRVHLSEAGHPILGDPLYGGRSASSTRLIDRLALHALSLGFTLPDGTPLYFEVPPPEDFAQALEKLARGAQWRS